MPTNQRHCSNTIASLFYRVREATSSPLLALDGANSPLDVPREPHLWSTSPAQALVVALEKLGASIGAAESFRPLPDLVFKGRGDSSIGDPGGYALGVLQKEWVML